MSRGLREFCLYYCNRLSFAEVAKLVERVSGERPACAQTLCNWAREKAPEVSVALCSEVAAARSLPLPAIEEAVDVYDASSKEVLVMSDAIQVKAQRSLPPERAGEPKRGKKANKKRVSTDLVLLEGRDGSFRCLSADLERAMSLSEVARARLKREWGDHPGPVPVVAITDGARSIRSMLEETFGPSVTGWSSTGTTWPSAPTSCSRWWRATRPSGSAWRGGLCPCCGEDASRRRSLTCGASRPAGKRRCLR